MTVHVSVDGLRIENPSAPGGVSERIGHMPFTEAAIGLSVTTRAAAEITVPADDEGYKAMGIQRRGLTACPSWTNVQDSVQTLLRFSVQ